MYVCMSGSNVYQGMYECMYVCQGAKNSKVCMYVWEQGCMYVYMYDCVLVCILVCMYIC